jgi:cobalt-zinc-cadmium efflux system protein
MAHEHGHSHRHGNDSERRVLLALVLTGVFMVVEVIGGLAAGSLALLADAGHMLTDTLSLALAFVAFRIGRWPQDARRTYGYHRFQVLAAFVNGLTLVAIVGWIAIEAIRRLLQPVEVLGGLMLAVAVVGLAVNLAAFAILHGGDRQNLNMRGATLHVLADLLGSVAAIVAALVISLIGWMPIDPLLSLAVAALILRSAWFLLRRSGHILLEGAPDWLDEAELRDALVAAVPAVLEVHHVHAWMLTTERPLITLHARVAPGIDQQEALHAIHRALAERFGIEHATVQIETAEGCPPVGATQAPA